jgi:hypothetical protein
MGGRYVNPGQPQTRESEISSLEAYAASLEMEFNDVKRKIKELKG